MNAKIVKNGSFKLTENTLLELMENSKDSFFKETIEKMLCTMNGEIKKRNDDVSKASYIAPRKVDLSLVEYKALYKFNSGRGRKPDIYAFKGEYFKLSELGELFNLSSKMLYQRIRNGEIRGDLNMVNVFGIQNHRIDTFIADNLKLMEV